MNGEKIPYENSKEKGTSQRETSDLFM